MHDVLLRTHAEEVQGMEEREERHVRTDQAAEVVDAAAVDVLLHHAHGVRRELAEERHERRGRVREALRLLHDIAEHARRHAVRLRLALAQSEALVEARAKHLEERDLVRADVWLVAGARAQTLEQHAKQAALEQALDDRGAG